MINWLAEFLTQSNFLPHRYCINGSVWLLTISVISNLLIFLSYFSIPIALSYFTHKRQELESLRFTLRLFAAFILACGTTHLLHVITYWQPWYWLQASLDALTAVISAYTAIYLWPLLPNFLNLRNPDPLLALNRQLKAEITERKAIAEALQQQINFSKTLINSLPGLYYRLDKHGQLVEWNDNFAMLLGEEGLKTAQADVLNIIADQNKIFITNKIAEGFAAGHAEAQASLKLASEIDNTFYFVAKTLMIDNQMFLLGTGIDITTRIAAETGLAEAHTLLKTVIDTVPMRVFWKDRNLRYLGCNTIFAKDAGMTNPDELIGKDDYQMGWHAQADLYRADDKVVMESGIAKISYDEPQNTPDGQVIWLRTSKVPLKNQSNQLIGMLGIYEDITQRKHMEQELISNETRLRSIINITPVPMMLNDCDNKITFINHAFIETFGYDPTEIPTLLDWWTKAYPNSEYRQWVIDTEKTVQEQFESTQKTTSATELRICCKDGTQKIVLGTATTIARPFGLEELVIFYDITEHKQLEEQLRNQSLYTRNLIEVSLDPLVTISAQGKITDVNTATEKVTGVAREYLIDTDFGTYFTDPDQAKAGYLLTFSNGYVTDYPLVIKHRNGHLTDVIYNAVVYKNQDGEIAGVFAAARDISKLKQAENDLKRSNADLEQFAYSVSHDMRQPLRAIAGHLQLLKRGLTEKLDEENQQSLAFALDGAKRMDAMILSLLEYSRVGRKTDIKAWLESKSALDEALAFLTPTINDTKTEVKITGQWPSVFASQDELTRLLMNLISNAIKYQEANQVPLVEVHSTVSDNRWTVRVRDYGIGINPKQIDRLFQFFSRLQSRARFEGTGMGLALCRRIVEHHSGKIWVESEGEGKGSLFVFELPLSAPDNGERTDEK